MKTAEEWLQVMQQLEHLNTNKVIPFIKQIQLDALKAGIEQATEKAEALDALRILVRDSKVGVEITQTSLGDYQIITSTKVMNEETLLSAITAARKENK